ncbi:MAG: PQ-loop domain-containing transporter [bacterium]|nr:PQ-loop domain-containing transporter [bacterium]
MAIFHLHKRKRIHLPHLEDFPSKKKWKRYLDTIIYAAGIAGPVLVIPQAYEIFVNKDASGVSIPSWIGFTLLAVIWLIYGIAHKEKPLILMYTGLVIMNALVFIGAIIYG